MMITPLVLLFCSTFQSAETLTLPLADRPKWLDNGIVMAGSWEPLLFRVRRDGAPGYTPTPQQKADYDREHSPEMVDSLKKMGVNFVMMHAYKAMGLRAEQESMDDAVRFAGLCHDNGLPVGVYCGSGTIGWELMFQEVPEASKWVVLKADGKPTTYGRAAYRYYWDRNNRDAQAFQHKVVQFSIEKIRADLLHFDNYIVGPGIEPNSQRRFGEYLTRMFSASQLSELGITKAGAVRLPLDASAPDVLKRAWVDFSCASLAESYYDVTKYARTLRKDILLECNPGGPGGRIRPPADHGRLLTGGEAFWDEGSEPGYTDNQLHTRIRTYKLARRMDNVAFAYTRNPLEAAESMAFNLNCLGCICWFEYGRIVAMPGSTDPVSPGLAPFVDFFNKRRDLFRDGSVVADVAVLRSFASQVFGPSENPALTERVEQELIENRIPFQIIYDEHLQDLRRYRILVLAGCVALSDPQIGLIQSYLDSGGHVLLLGPAGTHDEWMRPRKNSAFDGSGAAGLARIAPGDNVVPVLRKQWSDDLSLSVEAPAGVCAELVRQPNRYLTHLVNYRAPGVQDIRVSLKLPEHAVVKAVGLASPGQLDGPEIPFTTQANHVAFTVPKLDVYTIAMIALQQDAPVKPPR